MLKTPPTDRLRSSRLLKNRLLMPIFVMCAAMTRSMDRVRRYAPTIDGSFAPFSTLQADSSYRQKFWDADEVVGGSSEYEEPLDQAAAAMPGLAQTPDLIHPNGSSICLRLMVLIR